MENRLAVARGEAGGAGRRAVGVAAKGLHEGGPCSDGNSILTVDMNILVVILYHNFARCYHWRQLGKRNM